MNPTLEMKKTAPNEVTVVRHFNAPSSLVWRAFTEPELVKQWLTGPPGHSMPICEIDLRVDGKWRYVWQFPDGGQMIAYGHYQEIVPETKIVNSETFEMWPDKECQVTTQFRAVGQSTEVTMIMQYENEEIRDMVLKTGMTDGMEMSFARLESLLPGF